MLFLAERRRGRELAAQLKALEEQTAEARADEYRRQVDEERRLAAEALQRAEQRMMELHLAMMQERLAMMALMVKWLDAIDRNRKPAP